MLHNQRFEICLSHALAIAGWVATGMLGVSVMLVESDSLALRLGCIMVMATGASATVTVHGFLSSWESYARNAFQLGRDSAIDQELRGIGRS